MIRSLFLFVLLGFVGCAAQNSEVSSSVPKQLLVKTTVSPSEIRSVIKGLQGYTDLTSLLPKNYKRDASVDYTDFIQIGIDNFDKVIFPNFPILVNSKGLSLRSNTKVYFQEKSKLVVIPNELPRYEILRLFDLENVDLFYPQIVGDKFTHKGDTGEWGVGLYLRGSENINIYYPKIEKCWGDGITLAKSLKTSRANSNVKIYGGFIDNNRRNGISIISARNIYLNNILISNTAGTNPMTGLDIEPDGNKDELFNINLNDITTFNNKQDGIRIVFTRFWGKDQKNVGLSINNHRDYQSKNGLHVVGFNKGEGGRDNIVGYITVSNSVWGSTEEELKLSRDLYSLPIIEIKKSGLRKIKSTEDFKSKFGLNVIFSD